VTQLTLTIPQLTPHERIVLHVLSDYAPHCATELWDGRHGARIMAVAQRVSALRRKGYAITSTGKGGHAPAVYRLERP
jgi:biotin operon repressor